jgi:hypothetical protein
MAQTPKHRGIGRFLWQSARRRIILKIGANREVELLMTAREYNELWDRISRLSRQEKVELLTELTSQVRNDTSPRRDIMELAGLGKEIWEGIDAQDYVNQERDSWDG